MDNQWVVWLIIGAIIFFVIGSFSTLHKTASKPMRKKGLNDLEETLPRAGHSQNNKQSQSD
ncbi:hypothetical protein ACFSJY_11630 [Thalassotalea euphylliae]|uniref:hypothetical protein n=1 Tax=Thalassotalea euphylliae TaxID=1655234 RepID=UPI003639CB94